MTDIATVRALLPITLSARDGISLTLTPLGARMTGLWAPDRAGTLADIVLGHDRAEDYLTPDGYIGATCGRYGNRIAGGSFVLDGVTVTLDRNEGPNQLHGGSQGFDLRIWQVAAQEADCVTFALTSPDGDMGFPGEVKATCTYQLVGAYGLLIAMTATTSAPTVVNLVNHSYFNLAGQGEGDVLGHDLTIHADHYTPVDTANIPTGEIRAVAGTAFDFRTPRPIGAAMPGDAGFDHNFCLSGHLASTRSGLLRRAADLRDPASGRSLQVLTTEPGLQLYTGAHFDGSQRGKGGASYGKFAGVALETQVFPDSPNRPQFPSARLNPGQVYEHLMYLDLTPSSD